MVLHNHCSNCYNSKCTANRSDYAEDEICLLVQCPSGCGVWLHECKVDDHQDQTCPTHSISCINQLNGCPCRFPRSKLLGHLGHCPANVVTCNIEWNRWQKRSVGKSDIGDTEVAHPRSSDLLDVALAQRDQNVLEEALKMPDSLINSLRNSYTSNFPAVPLVQRNSGELRRNPEDSSLASLYVADECHDHSPAPTPGLPPSNQSVHCSLCKQRNENSGLASSITYALDKIQDGGAAGGHGPAPSDSCTAQQSGDQAKRQGSEAQDIAVDLVTEMFNSFRSKPTNMLTFLCAQDFRRDEFMQHYSTVHCDIQAGLHGWFQVRCPLAIYGCKFTDQRFTTNKKDRVMFHPVSNAFCMRPAQADGVEGEAPGADIFSNLPEEVLLTILGYMDSISLQNLSLTSKNMRSKCSYLLRDKGMVTLDWRKDTSGTWSPTQKIWSFSSVFDQPKKWIFSDIPSMADHLKDCPFNERINYTEDRIKLEFFKQST